MQWYGLKLPSMNRAYFSSFGVISAFDWKASEWHHFYAHYCSGHRRENKAGEPVLLTLGPRYQWCKQPCLQSTLLSVVCMEQFENLSVSARILILSYAYCKGETHWKSLAAATSSKLPPHSPSSRIFEM